MPTFSDTETLDLEINQGGDFVATMSFTETSDGSIIDLTSYTLEASIGRRRDDASPVASFTFEDQDLVNGTFSLVMLSAVTATLDEEDMVWDLWMTDTASKKRKWATGSVTLKYDV